MFKEILVDFDSYFEDKVKVVMPSRYDFKFFVNYLNIMFEDNEDKKQ